MQRLIQNISVQKKQSAKRLILGGSGYIFVNSQIRQKRFNLIFTHFRGMPLLVKQYEAFNPLNVRFFSLVGISLEANFLANLVKELHFMRHFLFLN
jgi:hypothetical protein